MDSFGLGLISSYSDEDEEEIDNGENNFANEDPSLISSRNDTGMPRTSDNFSAYNKGLNRLPLPSSILQLYKDKPEVNSAPEENPDLHDGRLRSFPHQRGNWSTYVYIPYEPEESFTDLLSRLQVCAKKAGVDLKTVSDPHISVTRTVVLLHHWIDSFINSVRAKLSHLSRFNVELGGPAVYCNEERTRTFLGLHVLSGSVQLREGVLALDDSLAEFRLPPFYKDPSFHMSILWIVGDFKQALETALPLLNAEFDAHVMEHPHQFQINVTQCLCKTGNKMFTFPLAS